MYGRRLLITGLGALAIGLAVAPAAAQAPGTSRIRATVVEAADGRLVVKAADGAAMTIRLVEPLTVTARVKATLADIKPGSYVGAAAVPLDANSLKAVELLIFPEQLRGTGEGHRPFDLLPESTMTNATVADTVTSIDRLSMRLAYKGGEKTVVVTPETLVFTTAPGARAELVAGAAIMATVTRKDDGTMEANRVSVDRR